MLLTQVTDMILQFSGAEKCIIVNAMRERLKHMINYKQKFLYVIAKPLCVVLTI